MLKARARRLALVAALALTLAGCAANGGPKKYTAEVKTNYEESCKQANQEKLSVADATTYCECTYAAFSDPVTGIPFKDFKAFDETVRDEAGKSLKTAADLKARFARFAAVFEQCTSAGPSLPTTTSGSSTTTSTTSTSSTSR